MYIEYWRCGSRITVGSGQLSGLPVFGLVSGLCTSVGMVAPRAAVTADASPAAIRQAAKNSPKPLPIWNLPFRRNVV